MNTKHFNVGWFAATIGFCFASLSAYAQTPNLPPGGSDSGVWMALFHCALFGLLGILLVTFGFKLFDLIITKIDLQEEIAKGNNAAAIVSAAAILAIGVIVALAIH